MAREIFSLRRTLFAIFFIAFAVVGGLVLDGRFFYQGFYYPQKEIFIPPEKFGLKPEEVFFNSNTGNKIHAWYFKNRKSVKPKGIFVFYHGNGENLSFHYKNLVWVLDHRYDMFIFDYPGYGQSEGAPSPRETVLSGEAALAWLDENRKGIPLIIFGESLGSVISLRNVIDKKNELPIRYVMIDAGFSSYRQAAREFMAHHSGLGKIFQWIPYVLLDDKYAVYEDLHKIAPIPLLVAHGDADATVRFSLGKKLFEKAQMPKTFWHLPGGTHLDIFSHQPDKYKAALLKELENVIKD